MLSTYAPLETMDSAGLPRRLRGPGRRGLQMDRCRRGGAALFRSIGTRCRKDLYPRGRRLGRVHGARRPPIRRRHRAPRKRRRGSAMSPICHNPRPLPEQTFFGDEVDSSVNPDPRTRSQAGADHHLAPERQGTRRGRNGEQSFYAAASGPRRLCHRRDHHGSGERGITHLGQRHLLRSPAFRALAAAQEPLSSLQSQPDARFGC